MAQIRRLLLLPEASEFTGETSSGQSVRENAVLTWSTIREVILLKP